jgi:AcrR family transcriptional regulator
MITTASRLMMTNGAATSLDQVNAEARVSRSRIYHYFADKNALISAVLTYQCGLVLAAHEAALQALVSTGDIVGWREFVIQAFQSRSYETGYLRQACGANSLQSQTNIRTSSGRCTCAGDSRSRRASRGSIPTNRFCDYQAYPCLASPRRPCCVADSVSAQFTETSAHSRKRWRSCFMSDHPMSATGAWVRRTIRCQVRCDRLCQPQLALVTAITCPAYLTPSVRSDGGDGTQRRLCPTSMR